MSASRITVALLLCVILCLSESKSIDGFRSNRPSHRDHAGMARYLVHKSNWTSMGTISSASDFQGYPMVNLKSIADSKTDALSTGNIYFMLTNLDFTAKDLLKNNKLTALFTEDQDLSCSMKNIDPMEPTCARAIFTGKMQRLEKETTEYEEAVAAFTSRHPASKAWQQVHGFYYCKFDIQQIAIIDFYGGAHYVKSDDYYNANYDSNDYEFNKYP